MTELTGRTVLVTGANRGLGREFVQQLLGRGVAKVYAAARNPATITDDDPRVVPLQLDVTDPDSVVRAAEVAHDVDVVVNNAGLSTPTPVLSGDTANLRRELEVNLFGPLAVTSAFADRLADRSGAVVNVASVLSWLGIGGSYSVSKAALWSATDSMRLDLTPRPGPRGQVPRTVRKLVLTGTGPAGGKDIDKVAGTTFYDMFRATLTRRDP